MNCMNDCRNRTLCKYFKEVQDSLNDGLRNLDLTAGDNGKTTYTYGAVFSALARSCNKYSSIESDFLSDKEIKELDKWAINFSKKLKTNKNFVKDFVNSKSPEHRMELISSEIDLELENEPSDSDLDEKFDYLRIRVFKEFGY